MGSSNLTCLRLFLSSTLRYIWILGLAILVACSSPSETQPPQTTLGEVELSVSRAKVQETVTAYLTNPAPEGVRVFVAGREAQVSPLDETSIRFLIPGDTPAGKQTVRFEAGSESLKRDLGVLGRDVSSGEALLVIKPDVSELALTEALEPLGFTLGDFVALGGEGPCGGQLATVAIGESNIGEALEALKTLGSDYLLGPWGLDEDTSPLIDPTSDYDLGGIDHLGAVSAKAAHERGWGGKDITIAVLDTGVSEHEDLENRLLAGRNFVTRNSTNTDPENASDRFPADGPQVGHGTPIALFAAGKTLGIAPEAKVMPVRVCSEEGLCHSRDVIVGICHALKSAPGGLNKLVLNLSWGQETPTNILESLLGYAADQGALVAAAAGNQFVDGASPKHYPAAYSIASGIVAVASVTETDGAWAPSSFSHHDEYLDIAAPGEGLSLGGVTAYSGTSFATALVAGALALWREAYPEKKAFWIEADLKDAAAELPFSSSEVGAGLLNLASAPSGVKPPPTNRAPTISSFDATASSVTVGQSVTFSWRISDLDGDELSCTIDLEGDGTAEKTIEACTSDSSFSTSFESAGAYTVKLTVKDSQGNSSARDLPVSVQPVTRDNWTRQLGSAGADYSFSSATSATALYVSGITSGSLGGTNAGKNDIIIAKYSLSGEQQWLRQFGSSEHDEALAVATDTSGNIYVTGWTEGNLDGHSNLGGRDVFLMKFSESRDRVWSRFLGTAGNDDARGIAVDSAGNIYVSGQTNSNLGGNYYGGSDSFLAKYDGGGNQLWVRQWGTAKNDYGRRPVTDSEGNIYVTGYANDTDVFLLKYNRIGELLWVREPSSSGYQIGEQVVLDSAGNLYIVGYTNGAVEGNTNAGDYDAFLLKYSRSGEQIWAQQLGSSNAEHAYGVAIDSNDGIFITGRTNGSLGTNGHIGAFDVFLSKFDTAGKHLWTSQLGTATDDEGFSVAVDNANSVYITGITRGKLDGESNLGSYDIFISKYSAGTVPRR